MKLGLRKPQYRGFRIRSRSRHGEAWKTLRKGIQAVGNAMNIWRIDALEHDVLNRMIQKQVTLVSLPSSNNKLTGSFQDYKDHPFSWWEKKGVGLGVGTGNDATLGRNFIREPLILLVTAARNLKITKLLMVATGETRRPYISSLLWTMRKRL